MRRLVGEHPQLLLRMLPRKELSFPPKRMKSKQLRLANAIIYKIDAG